MKTLVLGLGLCVASASCSGSSTHSSDATGGSADVGMGGRESEPSLGGTTAGMATGGAAGALTASGGTSSVGNGGRNEVAGAATMSGGSATTSGGGTSASTGGTNAGGASASGTNSGGTNSGGASASGGTAGTTSRTPSLLVFSRTVAYRHDSIPVGIKALQMLGGQRGWTVKASEDATLFSDAGLAEFNVLVFLSTTGDVLDDTQQAAMQRFIRSGKGFVGIHSASDTEYDWAWYGELVGAYFKAHPAIQSASVVVENNQHPATTMLASPWVRTDEWYAFRTNPRANVTVLLRLDESSYAPADAGMGADHPIAWAHEYDGGRAFYTALGHTNESYSEPKFLQHLTGAIEWAAR